MGLETREDMDGNADPPAVGAGIGGISSGAGNPSKLKKVDAKATVAEL